MILPFDTLLLEQFGNHFPLDSFVYVSSVVKVDSFVIEMKFVKIYIHVVYRQTNGGNADNR